MRNQFMGSILAMAAILACSIALHAQSVRKPQAAKRQAPDLSGVWDNQSGHETPAAGIAGPGFALDAIGRGGIPRNSFLKKDDPQPSMQPWALQKYNVNMDGIGIKDGSTADPNTLEPRLSCFPPGPTEILNLPWPFEIVQRPDQVILLFEWDHWVRRIRLDEKRHPDGYPVTWMGHSIGNYDGDALVVDTVGINDKSWLDQLGHPHTDALHLVERFRRVNHDTLEIELLFDDPKAYTKPWTGRKVFQLMPPGYRVMEQIVCEDYLELGKHR